MNLLISHKRLALAVACSAALAACDSITTQNDSPSIPRPASTVVIGGTVTGLSATRPVVLAMTTTNNGINDGVQEFSVRGTEVLRLGAVATGANYNVQIVREPDGRNCTIANGSGVATTDINNISVTCVRDETPLYTVTAAIAPALSAAPPEGFAVTLTTEEGSETIYPTAGQSSVTFTLPIFYPAVTAPPPFAFTVTSTNTVGGKTNKCLVNGGSRSLLDDDATTPANITTGITVASCLYTVSAVAQYAPPPGGVAEAMGAGGLQLALRNQITNEIDAEAPVITAYGPTAVAFPGTFASNADALYEVVVQNHPEGQHCIVQNGGTVNLVTANANVTAQVRCRNVPSADKQLKGVFQRDTPAIREVAEGDQPVGSTIPEPRVPTRDFLAFFPNGTFLHGTHRATATAGVEHGFYDYDPAADTLNFYVLTDTNGSAGSNGNRLSPAVAACGYTFSIDFPGGAPCAPTMTVGPLADFSGCGGTCTVTAPAWVEQAARSSQSGGLTGTVSGVPLRSNFNALSFNYPGVPEPITATEVAVTPGAPGIAGKLSMRFGLDTGGNLNPVWTMTEPLSTQGPIEGAWASEDGKRFFVYDATTLYGFHAGVNGAPNLQDACYSILDWRVAESFYTRRGGDANCMTTANAELGLTAVGTVDVPNATTTNTTAPLIPGFIGRLPGSRSNLVGRPSPVRYKVEAGNPDTLTLQNTLNDIPVEFPVVLKRMTTY
jgi:uncharacterized protein (UPF0179 family)